MTIADCAGSNLLKEYDLSLSHRVFHKQSLLQQAYQILRSSILSGELAAGQRLLETQLAAQLQISRTPVREALRLLQHDNLAVLDRQGVLRVATISAIAAAELYDCRTALEELSIRGACQYATKAQLQEMESLIQQAEKLIEADRSQLTPYRLLDLDYQFHRLLAKSANNAWLVTILEQIFEKMLLLRIQTIQCDPNVLEIRMEHHQIFDALVQRDERAGVQAIRDHLTASKERVIQAVQQIQQTIEAATKY
jgi:DNA-binding GntR family transcriptional regulator